jgi:septation ring formation regulator EzrA|tara:strand:- start:874 stop:1131 length:258 start_codon:yes stop_codon:yes gene_type:complete
MAIKNGDWNEMKRLVLSRMDDYGHQLEDLDKKVVEINTRLAVMVDREARELVMAKSMAIKVAGVIGTLVSAVVAGLFALFGSGNS